MFLEYITPRISRGALVKYNNESNNYTTRAVGTAHQFNEKTIMMKGRYMLKTKQNMRLLVGLFKKTFLKMKIL